MESRRAPWLRVHHGVHHELHRKLRRSPPRQCILRRAWTECGAGVRMGSVVGEPRDWHLLCLRVVYSDMVFFLAGLPHDRHDLEAL
eukprot:scaffold8478_cov286-Pinguiococcus_pyrenoidosus.AAC.3